MKKTTLSVMAVIMMSSLLAGCGTTTTADSANSNSGSSVKEPSTITIAWLPNNSGDNEKAFRDEFDKVIEKATGKKVENKLTTDYAIAISALESGDAQLGYFGPNEYIVSHAKDPKVIPLVVESGDSGTLNDALYHSRFLVKKGNEDQYKSGDSFDIDNITGKRMSFVSTSSTSGFNMPAAAILGKFTSQDKWKNLTKDNLAQGGSGKFFSQVLFAGSHQLSLVNVLTGKSDVSAVDDLDVAQYVTLSQGKDNEAGAVYTVKQGADAPFNTLAGSQFEIIKSIPVFNTPLEANSSVLSQKTLDAITNALTADETTKDTKIFAPKGAQGSVFVQPHRFLKVDDSWYDPMRKVLGYSK
ncbi:ABC-type phosphate/phosphonate transport system, periplasmic component [Desulfosporosinus acidiphilus SJ4]|uniref:ABC-type phosphate/phosphonate transport system, periplasmic component n=1 Tax=Desulfosporosinus acidiphilus (strain DSM 22704 / JCM 16185 / SJ4) TaxID=646529 RepID=I4D4J9_DESAJ|nr:phosphate/phosphite/phosphonate ABC transporter substrate-binding protein [Desulfosporosinus acidiphilus]AFM40723.1 ABC-type phosphate/phosphonate transport system, periplasmic component [Desulfosporosinus acidiphilus SJ4]